MWFESQALGEVGGGECGRGGENRNAKLFMKTDLQSSETKNLQYGVMVNIIQRQLNYF